MASLSTDANGNVTLQFVAADARRRTVRLGKLTRKAANEVKLKVEGLNAARIHHLPMDADLARWVAGIGDELAAKLAKVGLIPPRNTATLGGFLAEYARGRETDGSTKPATMITIRRVTTDLSAVLGANTPVRQVGTPEAEKFKRQYQEQGLAGATVYRRLKMCKMLFAHAVKLKLTAENPFADVKGKNANPAARRCYIPAADALRLIDKANPTWRVIVALARFAGLRCPSEVLSLRWADVDLAAGRMVVRSPKTEHLPGKESRVVPVFAALRPHLEDAYELAEPGEVYVVGGPQGAGYRASAQKPGGWVNTSLSSTFRKLIKRAGLTAWPRLFHNLRASCETDLMQNHPIHVVTAWIGNTPKIALAHYLQTLDADFAKAVGGAALPGAAALQNALRSGAEVVGEERKERGEHPEFSGVRSAPLRQAPAGSYCTIGQGGT